MEKENNIAPINEELNVVNYETENIKNLIYTVRGKQVMLDSDVAMLYNCETRIINQAVKRNIERFPSDFCFQLTSEEEECLRSQIVILNKNGRGQHRKYMPYVFTEQGIAMLSGLLKNEIAIKFHDRFMVIDNKDLYHIGAFLKDLGKKCFAISKIEDMEYIEKLKNII